MKRKARQVNFKACCRATGASIIVAMFVARAQLRLMDGDLPREKTAENLHVTALPATRLRVLPTRVGARSPLRRRELDHATTALKHSVGSTLTFGIGLPYCEGKAISTHFKWRRA